MVDFFFSYKLLGLQIFTRVGWITQTKETFHFGKFKIDPSEVFVVTEHSFGFVNLKPVVPGMYLSTFLYLLPLFLSGKPQDQRQRLHGLQKWPYAFPLLLLPHSWSLWEWYAVCIVYVRDQISASCWVFCANDGRERLSIDQGILIWFWRVQQFNLTVMLMQAVYACGCVAGHILSFRKQVLCRIRRVLRASNSYC